MQFASFGYHAFRMGRSRASFAGSLIRRAVALPVVGAVLTMPSVRRGLRRLPVFSDLYRQGWLFPHPFDRRYGTRTSGFVSQNDLPGSPVDTGKPGFYAASQPSIIRAALQAIPGVAEFSFIDLGCGKGRALMVATEFQFRAVVGVELSRDLAGIARENSRTLRRRFPARRPIEIELHDAVTYPFPPGNLVVFLYNPFGAPVIDQVAANLEARASTGSRIFVVYYNPVHGSRFDASKTFCRYFAATVPYAADEVGYGPDDDDTVVIWQAGLPRLPEVVGAARPIKIVHAEIRAALEH